MLAEFGQGREAGGQVGRDQIGHQTTVTVRAMSADHGGADRRVRGKDRLDLTGLDPKTTHLELVVRPAQELQTPLCQPAHPVSRAIQPGPVLREGVRDEPLAGQCRAAQIATGDPVPPMNSSPATPTGTGCNRSSRT